MDSRDMEIGVKIGALAIPATYSDREFTVLPETARTFNLDVSIVDQHIIMSNPFYLSAMGGGINFNKSLFEYTFNNPMGNFYASANCLTIKGNGESYTFPMEVVDNTCDHQLRISAFGKMNVTPEIHDGQKYRARVRSIGKKKLKVTLRHASSFDQILTIVYLKKNKIMRESQILKSGERSITVELKDNLPEVYKLFVNLDEVKF